MNPPQRPIKIILSTNEARQLYNNITSAMNDIALRDSNLAKSCGMLWHNVHPISHDRYSGEYKFYATLITTFYNILKFKWTTVLHLCPSQGGYV